MVILAFWLCQISNVKLSCIIINYNLCHPYECRKPRKKNQSIKITKIFTLKETNSPGANKSTFTFWVAGLQFCHRCLP